MKITVIEDAKVLVPNEEHKTLSHSKEIIKKGTEIEGDIKMINGMRRGEPFTYRVFRTNEGKIIFLNKTNAKMEAAKKTEVTLGMEGKPTGTVIDLPKSPQKKLIISGIVGAAAGFVYCKYKKLDGKKTMMYTLGGAVIGVGVGYLISRHHLKVKK